MEPSDDESAAAPAPGQSADDARERLRQHLRARYPEDEVERMLREITGEEAAEGADDRDQPDVDG